ncbi:hypothetical protein Moror_10206 [Moniliophthora roreri MCA 2997]|uniref:Uncharacterized protein n=1 Tax=Moniliophthora roreri (strain MCA 2997) TaxID=1381753 RepID=V2XY50_MONRO|nr:hypothetical protein Moror_10206 [Moniliophthora roreri MCA 2997]
MGVMSCTKDMVKELGSWMPRIEAWRGREEGQGPSNADKEKARMVEITNKPEDIPMQRENVDINIDTNTWDMDDPILPSQSNPFSACSYFINEQTYNNDPRKAAMVSDIYVTLTANRQPDETDEQYAYRQRAIQKVQFESHDWANTPPAHTTKTTVYTRGLSQVLCLWDLQQHKRMNIPNQGVSCWRAEIGDTKLFYVADLKNPNIEVTVPIVGHLEYDHIQEWYKGCPWLTEKDEILHNVSMGKDWKLGKQNCNEPSPTDELGVPSTPNPKVKLARFSEDPYKPYFVNESMFSRFAMNPAEGPSNPQKNSSMSANPSIPKGSAPLPRNKSNIPENYYPRTNDNGGGRNPDHRSPNDYPYGSHNNRASGNGGDINRGSTNPHGYEGLPGGDPEGDPEGNRGGRGNRPSQNNSPRLPTGQGNYGFPRGMGGGSSGEPPGGPRGGYAPLEEDNSEDGN